MSVAPPLLAVRNLRTLLPIRSPFGGRGVVRAVDGVSFEIRAGRTFGLVGESGCGKSTLARTVLRLTPASSGRIQFDGTDVLALRGGALREYRRQVQVVFQDPAGSLNPRLTVGEIVGEALSIHGLARSRSERDAAVASMLERVGLAADDLRRFPHEFSGGQRQRIGIARALVLRPRLVICDEPVSALDVSIQSQILNLLADLQAEFGLAYLFIAHNLSVMRHFCDEIAVMYLGRIVESGPTADVIEHPIHPYTRALLSAAPRVPSRDRAALRILPGEPPNPIAPPPGCAFHTRCPDAIASCAVVRPELAPFGDGHAVACPVNAPASAEEIG
ncbi:MAG: ATP-binding cassette domain-containing protein [Planctomycetes bacterium]|nr:ATP-binding cassette domain-containing protein [Planctomycetota bacterium]